MVSLSRVHLTALIVASMLFMEQLDGTILSTALPSIANSLHVDTVATSVALTAYIIGLAIFIPASGALADRLGSRTVLSGAIIMFVLCSVACASAHSLTFLACMRTLQGIGGALMVPVGRLVVLRSTPREELVRTMTWMMLPATLGPLLGPVVGGFITTYLSWRWNFYLNIPVGVIGLILTRRFIPEVREKHPPPFDLKGMFLAGGGLALLSLVAELFSHNEGTKSLILTLLLMGTGLMSIYGLHAQRIRAPLLDFRLLATDTFRISVIGGAASRIAVGAFPFLLPTFLQIGTGMTAAQSGMVTFLAPVGAIGIRPFVPAILRKWGFRRVLVTNGLSAGILAALLAQYHRGQSLWVLAAILLASGMAQSVQFSAYNTIAYADIPASRMSAATSFYATMQQLMLSLGICIAAGTLTLTGILNFHSEPTPHDFVIAFLVVGFISLLATPAAARLAPNAGAVLTGKKA
ncbi:MFS transporter [Acetobacter cibinongensis]|uniref:Major facilitator transporter n=1 Tax=Acetobacter cibinongensis TaxID=146475 RepID=A0A1Z5YUP8_9PROT|nr:MFS transporter [Acetobacter cibinongensis]OUJ02336.1 major facilitator transporter [Acetobacter cibinongensis]